MTLTNYKVITARHTHTLKKKDIKGGRTYQGRNEFTWNKNSIG